MPPRRTALITGASSGIGRAFAEEYAAHHNKDLILVARSGDVLEALATRLADTHGCRAEVIVADLTEPGAVQRIVARVAELGMQVDVLINNAGVGSFGPFTALPAERVQAEVTLNCAAVAALCHAFVPHMVEQRFGSIVNVASIAAHAPMPYMSLYAATKAFVLSFSSALRAEVRPHGLRVVALCPGPVATNFYRSGTSDPTALMPPRAFTPVEDVVASALDTLRRNRERVTPGLRARALGVGLRLVPTRYMAAITRRMMARIAPADADSAQDSIAG